MAVLDMGLPDGFGSDLVAELRELRPPSAVLILSADLDVPNLARARGVGAAGILDKFAEPKEVIGAIRRLGNA